MIAATGAVIYFAIGRLKARTVRLRRSNDLPEHCMAYLHSYGIIFLSFLFFICLAAIIVLTVHAPMFKASRGVPSQGDAALFVWDAMASRAFKFLSKYLDLAQPICASNQSSP